MIESISAWYSSTTKLYFILMLFLFPNLLFSVMKIVMLCYEIRVVQFLKAFFDRVSPSLPRSMGVPSLLFLSSLTLIEMSL